MASPILKVIPLSLALLAAGCVVVDQEPTPPPIPGEPPEPAPIPAEVTPVPAPGIPGAPSNGTYWDNWTQTFSLGPIVGPPMPWSGSTGVARTVRVPLDGDGEPRWLDGQVNWMPRSSLDRTMRVTLIDPPTPNDPAVVANGTSPLSFRINLTDYADRTHLAFRVEPEGYFLYGTPSTRVDFSHRVEYGRHGPDPVASHHEEVTREVAHEWYDAVVGAAPGIACTWYGSRTVLAASGDAQSVGLRFALMSTPELADRIVVQFTQPFYRTISLPAPYGVHIDADLVGPIGEVAFNLCVEGDPVGVDSRLRVRVDADFAVAPLLEEGDEDQEGEPGATPSP